MRDLRSAKTRFAPPDRKHDAAWNPKALLDRGKHLPMLFGTSSAPVHNAADRIEIGAWRAELRLVLAAAAVGSLLPGSTRSGKSRLGFTPAKEDWKTRWSMPRERASGQRLFANHCWNCSPIVCAEAGRMLDAARAIETKKARSPGRMLFSSLQIAGAEATNSFRKSSAILAQPSTSPRRDNLARRPRERHAPTALPSPP